MAAEIPPNALKKLQSRINAWTEAMAEQQVHFASLGQTMQLQDIELKNVDFDADGLVVPNRSSKAKVTHTMKVRKDMLNLKGSVHGGCWATIIDIQSSFAILCLGTKTSFWNAGVSTDITVRYLAPGLPGDVIRIVSETIKVGKNTALAQCNAYNQDGVLLVTALHQKANTDAPKKSRDSKL